MPHTSHPPRSPLINAHLRRYEIQSLCEVFIADPVTTWPKSGVKQTLVDNLDTSFTFTYKFVYGNNLNADGATEDDDVPIVRGDPVSKKKKSDSGIDLGLAIGVLIAAVILAFCCGAACCVYRRRKDDPVAEVNGRVEVKQ